MAEASPPRLRPFLMADIRRTQLQWSEGKHGENPTEPETGDTGYFFVPENGSSRPKGEVRKLIRAQTRRNQPLRSQSKRSYPLASQASRPDTAKDPQGLAGLVLLRNTIQRDIELRLMRSPQRNSFEPFGALPIDDNKHGDPHYILHKCYERTFYPRTAQQLYSPVISIRPDEYLRLCVTDTALLHVLLGTIVQATLIPGDTKAIRYSEYHTARAISLLNQRIQNGDKEGFTNTTILCIVMLGHYELLNSSTTKLKIHMDGLEAMIQSRGGIQSLASSILPRCIYFMDCFASIALDTKPRFHLINTELILSEPEHWGVYNRLVIQYKIKLSNLTGLPDLSKETIECYRILRNLIIEKTKCDKPGASLLSMGITKAKFEAYSNELLYRLTNIVRYKVPRSSNLNPGILVSKLFANAAIAEVCSFIITPLRKSSSNEIISATLRKAFETTDIDIKSLLIICPEMTIWTIMIGGMLGSLTNNYEFFAQLLAKSCLVVGICSMRNELPVFLEDFLWSDLYFSPIYEGFWDEVALALATEIEMRKATPESSPTHTDFRFLLPQSFITTGIPSCKACNMSAPPAEDKRHVSCDMAN
ncbi:hypothetical protein N431DRAFT_440857 [Stipitochalara longipes BDJ]|nr:hypothetical protein N431DRAFT_440857 [Stipitochalara longipes BDJ]